MLSVFLLCVFHVSHGFVGLDFRASVAKFNAVRPRRFFVFFEQDRLAPTG
jgi:hypothetical protein